MERYADWSEIYDLKIGLAIAVAAAIAMIGMMGNYGHTGNLVSTNNVSHSV